MLGVVLPKASRVVNTGIVFLGGWANFLCIKVANSVSLAWMVYVFGTTLSKNTRNMRGSIVSYGLWWKHSAASACWSLDWTSLGSSSSTFAE